MHETFGKQLKSESFFFAFVIAADVLNAINEPIHDECSADALTQSMRPVECSAFSESQASTGVEKCFHSILFVYRGTCF